MSIKISEVVVIDDTSKGIFNSLNVGVYASGSEPALPSIGDMIYNSTENLVKVYNGSSWV